MMVFINYALAILYAGFYKKANYSPGSSKTDGPIYKGPPATHVFLSFVDTCKGIGQQIIKELD